MADRHLTGGDKVGVGAGHVRGCQRGERDPTDGRHELSADDALIALQARRPEPQRRDLGQPALEEIADCLAGIVDDAELGLPDRLVAFRCGFARPRSSRGRRVHRPTLALNVDVPRAPAALRHEPAWLLA
jgi:hypothetical protein